MSLMMVIPGIIILLLLLCWANSYDVLLRRTDRPEREVDALYRPVTNILQVAQSSKALRAEIGNACHKLEMKRLFLAPVAQHISDPILTAIVQGGSSGVSLPIETLSLSGCVEVSGQCLEGLAPCLANTITILCLKVCSLCSPYFFSLPLDPSTLHSQGLILPSLRFCNLVKSLQKLQHLSMPHCCYRDTYMPLQTLSTYCRNLKSLEFGCVALNSLLPCVFLLSHCVGGCVMIA